MIEYVRTNNHINSHGAYHHILMENFSDATAFTHFSGTVRKKIDRHTHSEDLPELPNSKYNIKQAITGSLYELNYEGRKAATNKTIIANSKIPEDEKHNIMNMDKNALYNTISAGRDRMKQEMKRIIFCEAMLGDKYGDFQDRTGFIYLGTNIRHSFHAFCATFNAKILHNLKLWCMDSSHPWTPRIAYFRKPYDQCLVINAVYTNVGPNQTNVSLPCIWVLMSEAHEDEYIEILRFIVKRIKKVHKIDLSKNYHEVMCDYEKGERNAVKEVFPSWKVWGCFFYFAQALVTNIKTHKNMISKYRSDIDFQIYCRCFQMLALIPVRFVPLAFDLLKKQYKKEHLICSKVNLHFG